MSSAHTVRMSIFVLSKNNHMKKSISTTITIYATPAEVWKVLTDFAQFPNWNPFVKSISGTIQVGEIIEVKLQPPGGKSMTFRPKVLRFEETIEFRWLGHLFIPGIFDGEHYFKLTDNLDGTTAVEHGEHFKGILVGVLQKMLDNQTKAGFEEMNRALKVRVEG